MRKFHILLLLLFSINMLAAGYSKPWWQWSVNIGENKLYYTLRILGKGEIEYSSDLNTKQRQKLENCPYYVEDVFPGGYVSSYLTGSITEILEYLQANDIPISQQFLLELAIQLQKAWMWVEKNGPLLED